METLIDKEPLQVTNSNCSTVSAEVLIGMLRRSPLWTAPEIFPSWIFQKKFSEASFQPQKTRPAREVISEFLEEVYSRNRSLEAKGTLVTTEVGRRI